MDILTNCTNNTHNNPCHKWNAVQLNPTTKILSSKYLLNEWMMTTIEITLRC
jgi:hypothetical protein